MSTQLPKVQPSEHARLRWVQRGRAFGQPLEYGFEESEVLDEHGDIDAQELRYHAATHTILIVNNSTITTVIDAATVQPAIKAAIDRLESDQHV